MVDLWRKMIALPDRAVILTRLIPYEIIIVIRKQKASPIMGLPGLSQSSLINLTMLLQGAFQPPRSDILCVWMIHLARVLHAPAQNDSQI